MFNVQGDIHELITLNNLQAIYNLLLEIKETGTCKKRQLDNIIEFIQNEYGFDYLED